MMTFLANLPGFYLELRNAGEAIQASFSQRIQGQPAREPDVMVVLSEHLDRIKSNYLDGPADIAVEIVSSESVERHYDDKFKEYAAAGVREYWIVDMDRRIFDVHQLDEQGRYVRRLHDRNGHVTSGLLPGFRLSPKFCGGKLSQLGKKRSNWLKP